MGAGEREGAHYPQQNGGYRNFHLTELQPHLVTIPHPPVCATTTLSITQPDITSQQVEARVLLGGANDSITDRELHLLYAFLIL